MSPEEKYILLMEAAYTATDKDTYYKLMQKADQVLKDAQATLDSIDAEAASRTKSLNVAGSGPSVVLRPSALAIFLADSSSANEARFW